MAKDKPKQKKEAASRRQSNPQTKLELIEYVDKRMRNLECDLQERFNQRVKDYKQELKDMAKTERWIIWVILAFFGVAGGLGFWGAYSQVSNRVLNRLDEEFKTERIRTLIDVKAKEHTEARVNTYVDSRVDELLTPFRNEMQDALNQASGQLEKLNTLFAVFVTADNAKNGSKSSYLELKRYAAEDRTQVGIAARERLRDIERDLQVYRNVPGVHIGLSVSTERGKVKLKDLPLDEIVKVMLDPLVSHDRRRRCMPYVTKRPKHEVLQKAMVVFRSDSLPTCAGFCGVLSHMLGNEAEFLDFDGWLEACEKELARLQESERS
jgi:hypothetical protein